MEEYKSFLDLFGIDLSVLGALLIGIIAVTNFLKSKFAELQGNWILLPVLILSAIGSIAVFPGDVTKIIVATIILTVISTGTWDTTKQIAHKVGVGMSGTKKVK